MADAGMSGVPESPETQPQSVREQLDQEQISHDGDRRETGDATSGADVHLGAVETEVTPNMPPVRGPEDLVASSVDDDEVDPADEITPG